MSFTCNYKCPSSGLSIDNACIKIEAVIYRPLESMQIVYQVYVSQEALEEGKGSFSRDSVHIPYKEDVSWFAEALSNSQQELQALLSPPQ